jgi:endonuclease V-like protein UPF0215 family
MHQRKYLEKIKVIGIDDGRFKKQKVLFGQNKVLIIAALFNGYLLNDIYISDITVDGLDSTKFIYLMLKNVDFDFLLLSGITFAGFNIVDVLFLNKQFSKPIIVITSDKPKKFTIKKALKKHFKDWEKRWKLIEAVNPIYKIHTNPDFKPIYFEFIGTTLREVSTLLLSYTLHGRIPEPIRVANILAKELSYNTREKLNFQLENNAF